MNNKKRPKLIRILVFFFILGAIASSLAFRVINQVDNATLLLQKMSTFHELVYELELQTDALDLSGHGQGNVQDRVFEVTFSDATGYGLLLTNQTIQVKAPQEFVVDYLSVFPLQQADDMYVLPAAEIQRVMDQFTPLNLNTLLSLVAVLDVTYVIDKDMIQLTMDKDSIVKNASRLLLSIGEHNEQYELLAQLLPEGKNRNYFPRTVTDANSQAQDFERVMSQFTQMFVELRLEDHGDTMLLIQQVDAQNQSGAVYRLHSKLTFRKPSTS